MKRYSGFGAAFAALPLIFAATAFAQAPTAPPPAPPATTPAPEAVKPVTRPTVTIETAKGKIVIELYPEDAPKAAGNFATLVKKGFYNGLTFHRVEPGFVIQGGDPDGNGTGGPGYTIDDEVNKTLTHEVGAVAMAKSAAPNSAGSQFYIVIGKPAHFLDGRYTVFGKVVSGQAVADKIVVGDKMTTVSLVEPAAATTTTPPVPGAAPAAPAAASKITRAAEPDVIVPVTVPFFEKPKPLKSYKAKIKVVIEADGKVSKTEIKSGTGVKEMDAAIKEAFGRWTWKPALKDGKPIKSERNLVYDVLNSSHRYE